MKDEGFVPRAGPDTFILLFQGILRTVVTAQETTPEAVGENSRWSSASRDTRVIEQLTAARTPPDRRSPHMCHPGGMEDSWSRARCVSTTPARVGFSIVTVPVVFAPPRFSRRLR